MTTLNEIFIMIRQYNLKIFSYNGKIKILNIDKLHPTKIYEISNCFKRHKQDILRFLYRQKQKLINDRKRHNIKIDNIDKNSYRAARNWISQNYAALKSYWSRPQLFRYPFGLAWRSCWGPYMLGRAVKLEIGSQGQIVFYWLIGSTLTEEKIVKQTIHPLDCVDFPSLLLS